MISPMARLDIVVDHEAATVDRANTTESEGRGEVALRIN
jgi:hypothetical protein